MSPWRFGVCGKIWGSEYVTKGEEKEAMGLLGVDIRTQIYLGLAAARNWRKNCEEERGTGQAGFEGKGLGGAGLGSRGVA